MSLDLPIIQQTYDLIAWYSPILQCFPRNHKFVLGDRIHGQLYGLLEGLIRARYRRDKLALLEDLNADMDILRYQTRLCREFGLFDTRRYEYASKRINEIGQSLGGWIRHQRRTTKPGLLPAGTPT